MRSCFLAVVVSLLPGVSDSAWAQRFIIIPEHGSGDRVVVISELPPEALPVLRAQLGTEPKVAFLYEHFFILHPAFDLWTWNGRFVLYRDGVYWPMPREAIAALLGPDGESKLSVPLGYWLPSGLATFVGLIVALSITVYVSRSARARRVLKDDRFQKAVEVYARNMPPEGTPSAEDRDKAFAAALSFLENEGMERDKAEPGLRLVIAELDHQHSLDLRAQAVEHEQQGEWDQAIALYEQAARLCESVDRKDYEFLLTCIERVRGKQARAG